LAVVLGEQTRSAAALRSSEARLLALTRELVHAREEEATRIGRELHDDVGQRLALVSIGLSRLRQAQAPGTAGLAPDIRQLQEQASAIAQSLREISHRLHPVTLEHVGLAMALELKCEEVQQAAGVNLHMANHGDSSAVPRDVALCVFRVAQEVLNNVVRHSGAHSVDLLLRCDGDEVRLAVADDGHGFAPSTPGFNFGLGLHSAAERVASVGGTLAIESTPGAGTTVCVAIPIRESDGASPAGHPC
jgi:two-component system sensor histidine kinase UhpB